MTNTVFITGTGTGVGKTVLTVALTRHLRTQGVRVLAVKPFCSGGRDDAHQLAEAQHHEVTLDAINPWHFRAALTPLLAARLERRIVERAEVVKWLKARQWECDVLLIEGAGGLLSPLGEGFDAGDLIQELHAEPVVVCPNELGAIHQVRATFSSLPDGSALRALAVLRATGNHDAAGRTNADMLREFLGRDRVLEFPKLALHASLPTSAVASLEKIRLKMCSPQ
ncbi:MAG TPA: dethiobiotin synthase [Verrucomicrobiales bacterium]|nr:dethiobiotin synthase [Verrucomicrobiales bacterium]